MSHWSKGLVAVMAVGVMLGLLAGPAQAASKAKEKPAKGAEKSASAPLRSKTGQAKGATAAPAMAQGPVVRGKAAPAVSMRIRPAQVAAVPAASAREPVLLPVAIEDDTPTARPAKVVPVRAYALDGSSFYQNGQLIRIQGLADDGAGGEHTKQRLQQMLDGGLVTVLPVAGSTGGEIVAVVRVNGRDLAEAMAGSN